jgi:hypothetical protein
MDFGVQLQTNVKFFGFLVTLQLSLCEDRGWLPAMAQLLTGTRFFVSPGYARIQVIRGGLYFSFECFTSGLALSSLACINFHMCFAHLSEHCIAMYFVAATKTAATRSS